MSTSWSRPEPPYYAVIITSVTSGDDPRGYSEMSARMAELGQGQPGYLGRESLVAADGHELTVIYYVDRESIDQWKAHPEHLVAQALGRSTWYSAYQIEIARVERAYSFEKPPR